MAIPTRLIEQEEFDELMKLEGGTLPMYRLTAIPFDPSGEIKPEDYKSVRVLMLNVAEPRLYRDKQKVMFVVFPSYAPLLYEDMSDMHPAHEEWCYRFAPYTWDGLSDLSDAHYTFKDEKLAPFDINDVLTH